MIDEEWLQQINYDDFVLPDTLEDGRTVKIDGFLGLGQNLVFSGVTQDGEGLAIKMDPLHLGFHIRELPFFLTGAPPRYDLNRLNQKLLNLVGNPILDTIAPQYNVLYDKLIEFIEENGVSSLISLNYPAINETLPFILNTPGMKRRLHDLADIKDIDLLDQIANIFPVTNPNAQPDTLFNNPIYVWGAAAIDGFFTSEELPLAVKFIEEHFGCLVKHPQTLTFLEQNFAIANLLAQCVHVPSALRFVELCRLAGFIFRVYDREYKVLEVTDYKWEDGEYGDKTKVIMQGTIVDVTLTQQLTATEYFNRGNMYDESQRYDEAVADYSRALQLEPAFVEAYNNRGLIYGALQRYQESLEDFTQAIHLNPTLVHTYYNRGNTYHMMQCYKEALADYTQATRLNPNYKSAYTNRGLTYTKLQRYNDALDDHTRTIELDPNDAISYDNRGLAYAEMGLYSEALKDFTQAIQIDPLLAQPYNNRGSTYESLGRYEEALKDFSRSIGVDPAYAPGYLSMGALLADRGALEEALSYLEKAEQLGDQLAPHYIAKTKERLR